MVRQPQHMSQEGQYSLSQMYEQQPPQQAQTFRGASPLPPLRGENDIFLDLMEGTHLLA